MAEVAQILETNIQSHEKEDFGEKCGVFGVFEPGTNVAETTYNGLVMLKHRGQDAAGQVVVDDSNKLHLHKALGGVVDVFYGGEKTLPDLLPRIGKLAIGHDRYGTMSKLQEDFRKHAAQPILGKNHSFAGAYNGDVANIHEVMRRHGFARETYVSDTEAVIMLLDSYMSAQQETHLPGALMEVLPQLEGAFCGVFTDGKSLIAARDPNGFRPFVYGVTETGGHVVSSEIRAFRKENEAHATIESIATFNREIQPGEMLVIDEQGVSSEFFAEATPTPCSYEFFYFSKEDNIFHDQKVGDVRWRLGEELALEHPVYDVDLVVGVPNSGVVSAEGYAKKLGIAYEQVIIKNPDKKTDTRTFIANTQDKREAIARAKFLIEAGQVDGKSVAIIDDSVIRGTVTKIVIEMLRDAGAEQVHVRVPAPSYKYPCHYGMDTGRPEEFLVTNRSHDEMVEFIGADSLAFLSPEGVHRATKRELGKLCVACSTGNYPTATPVSIHS